MSHNSTILIINKSQIFSNKANILRFISRFKDFDQTVWFLKNLYLYRLYRSVGNPKSCLKRGYSEFSKNVTLAKTNQIVCISDFSDRNSIKMHDYDGKKKKQKKKKQKKRPKIDIDSIIASAIDALEM